MTAFSKLSSRERLLILAVLPLALLLIGYQFVWQPMQDAQTRARADIAAFRLVQDTAALALRVDVPAPVANDDMPLATRITSSAAEMGLSLRRIEPEGQGSRVTLEDTAFSSVLVWLADLEELHNVTVRAIQIDRRPEPGIVTARLLLERSQ